MNEEKKVPFKWEYGEETISLQLGMYANNQRLYIGMITHTEDGAEPFADMTVNLSSPCGLCSGCGEADPLVQEVQRQITCGNRQRNDYAGEQQ